jgi:hypothetical protein
LPGGRLLELDISGPPYYLNHRSNLGQMRLSSDGMIPTFRYLALVKEQIAKAAHEEFMHIGYTIGGMIAFPAWSVDGRRTINQARGWHPSISDRFDLTLECIRRHYLGQSSPLGAVLGGYTDFFALFGDFAHYVDFFLLQDLVDEESQKIRFMMPFKDFGIRGPRPRTLNEYVEYRGNAIAFLQARNRRIAAHVDAGRVRRDPGSQ